MNEHSDLLPNLVRDDAFEVQLRGYSRRQVDEFVARCRDQINDLEERLARSRDETEQLRKEVTELRRQALGKPAHEAVSERIAQILKLADDEAQAQKSKANEEITKQREQARQEAERVREQAKQQAERMLTAAQEQAERAISTARAEAEKTRTSARADAERMTSEARTTAETIVSTAKAQAKRTLDEATARATAIHDGAERRLNVLSSRHAETLRRLTEILDGVSALVESETSRPSLEEEVAEAVAAAMSQPTPATQPDDGAAAGTGTRAAAAGRPASAEAAARDLSAASPAERAARHAQVSPPAVTPTGAQSTTAASVGIRADVVEPAASSGDPGAATGQPMPRRAESSSRSVTSPGERDAAPSISGAIDPDESTEGVRVMPSQRSS